ncbi:MAG: sugar ABC transporter permease [Caldilineaceae bacterium]|nr:sugar ABC transporter permease [Caldilineaceae bacterium]MCB0187755.1 sugar ABC transporter permease [Caldilineaceae bacterium]
MEITANRTATPPVAVGQRKNWRIYWRRTWPLYAMLLLPLIQLALFHYYPMYGVVIAFQKFNPGLGFSGSPWVGLANFRDIFANPDFKTVLTNSFVIAIMKIVTLQLIAVSLALMLNEVRLTFFKRTVQTVIYLPHFLSWIVLGGILIDLLAATGLVNRGLMNVGMEPILFLGSNAWFRPVVVVTNLWKEAGWATIIYLAALTGIDPVLHEAAAIDGANRWQRIRHVNLPGILSIIILLACLNLGSVLQAGFEQILTLYNPAVYATGDILDTYVYRAGLISARYSLAGAVGLFQSVMGFILIVIAYRLAAKYAGYRIF